MNEFLIAGTAAMLMALTTVLVHYEALSLVSRYLRRYGRTSRLQVIVVIMAVLAAHMLEVCLYAVAIMAIDQLDPGASIGGPFDHSLAGYVYYSLMSYTSLGLGEIFPYGSLRLLTAFAALNGLLLIGWSASFTYLVMAQRWKL